MVKRGLHVLGCCGRWRVKGKEGLIDLRVDVPGIHLIFIVSTDQGAKYPAKG